MEDKLKKTLEDFVDISNSEIGETKQKNDDKAIILNERDGLIERLDKKYVTSDGRILLREQY